MSRFLRSAFSATWIVGACAIALWLFSMEPSGTLKGVTLYLMQFPLLILSYVTELPLARQGDDGFLVPTAFGFAFIVGMSWLFALVMALAIGHSEEEGFEEWRTECDACGATGFTRIGSLTAVCTTCHGHGWKPPPNKSLERTRAR